MLERLEVGMPYSRIVGRGEGVFFDISYPGIELIYNYDKPTREEIAAVKMDKPVEIRVVEIDGVIIVTSKFGSLRWSDAPYNPRLGRCQLDELEPGTLGYGLTFFLTESPSGVIRHMRLLGLGNSFSRGFRDMVYANKKVAISVSDYDKKTTDVFSRFNAEDIANRSTLRYRIKGNT